MFDSVPTRGRRFLEQSSANPDVLRHYQEIEPRNRRLKEYILDQQDLITNIVAENARTGRIIRPLTDIRDWPETYAYHTFALATEEERARRSESKDSISAVCFGINSKTFETPGEFTLEVIVVGKNAHDQMQERTFTIPSSSHETHCALLQSFGTWLSTHRDPVIPFETTLAFITDRLTTLTHASVTERIIPEYIPWAGQTIQSVSALVSENPATYLLTHCKKDEHVEQGNETMFRTSLGDPSSPAFLPDVSFLQSGDMCFTLNNIPIDRIVRALASEQPPILSDAELSQYLAISEGQATVQETGEKYAARLEAVKPDGDLSIDWATAIPTYAYDPFRDCHYLQIAGQPVMDDFEHSYISLLGQRVAAYGGAVGEIGFGMGISANAIQKELRKHHTPEHPCVHVIFELNHEVANRAREWARYQKIPVIVLEGNWRDSISRIPEGVFSGFLSDPFAIKKDEINRDAALASQEVLRTGKQGCVFGLYADGVTIQPDSHQPLMEGWTYRSGITVAFGGQRNLGEYWGTQSVTSALQPVAHYHYLPLAYKDGGTGASEIEHTTLSTSAKKRLLRRICLARPELFLHGLLTTDPRQTSVADN